MKPYRIDHGEEYRSNKREDNDAYIHKKIRRKSSRTALIIFNRQELYQKETGVAFYLLFNSYSWKVLVEELDESDC